MSDQDCEDQSNIEENESLHDPNDENKEEEEGAFGGRENDYESEPPVDDESIRVDFSDYHNKNQSPNDTDNKIKEEEEAEGNIAKEEDHKNEQHQSGNDADYKHEEEASGNYNDEEEDNKNKQIVISNYTQTEVEAVGGHRWIDNAFLGLNLRDDTKFFLCALYLEVLLQRRQAALSHYQPGAVSVFDPILDAPVDISQDPSFCNALALTYSTQSNKGYQSRLVGPEDLLEETPARPIIKYHSGRGAGRKSVCFDDRRYVREVSAIGLAGFAYVSVPTLYVNKVNTNPLRNLASEYDDHIFWFIAADFETFLYDYRFLIVLADSDFGCRLLVPTIALQQLRDFYEATHSQLARRVIRNLEHLLKAHCAVLLDPEKGVIEERPETIISSCRVLVLGNYQVFLICKDPKLIRWQASAKVIILTPDQAKALIDSNGRKILYRPSKRRRLKKKNSVVVSRYCDNFAAVTDLNRKRQATKPPRKDPEELFQKLYAAIDESP